MTRGDANFVDWLASSVTVEVSDQPTENRSEVKIAQPILTDSPTSMTYVRLCVYQWQCTLLTAYLVWVLAHMCGLIIASLSHMACMVSLMTRVPTLYNLFSPVIQCLDRLDNDMQRVYCQADKI